MKTLKESLLDDEDDLMGDANNELIENWCNKHLLGWKRVGGYIKDYKINIKYVPPGENVEINLGDDGIIPDFIKWGNTFGAKFVNYTGQIKSFKNFPTEFKEILIFNKNIPNDFTGWNSKIHAEYLGIDNIKSLKGLEGNIKELSVGCDNLIEFNCPKLTVEQFKCEWLRNYKLKSFDNLPKIEDIFDISFNPKAKEQARKANIKKPNKITWNDMRAPSFIFDALNK